MIFSEHKHSVGLCSDEASLAPLLTHETLTGHIRDDSLLKITAFLSKIAAKVISKCFLCTYKNENHSGTIIQ